MKTRRLQACLLPGLAVVAMSMVHAPLDAKSGRDKEDRAEFRGVIEARPQDGLRGRWVIGGKVYDAGRSTEFDQQEGPLEPGNCAKVSLRDGQVHEIDSEPMRDCT